MRTQLPLSKKGAELPQFLVLVCCGQTAGWIKNQDATWYGDTPRPKRHMLDGNPAVPSPKRGLSPHVYCCQTVGWINMPLGIKPGHVVLYGDVAPAPYRRG